MLRERRTRASSWPPCDFWRALKPGGVSLGRARNAAVTRARIMVAVQFRLLGTFEVDADGVAVTPARPKQRALLALPVLRASEGVARRGPPAALWGSAPP